MRKIEKNKGITLIALVITIIVILILGGVSIKLIVGDDGLIARGKEARNSALNMASSTEENRESLIGEIAGAKDPYNQEADADINLILIKSGDTSIKATATTTTNANLIVSYTFYIKKVTENDSSYVTIKKSDKLDNTATQEGLETNNEYKVRAVITNKDGKYKTVEDTIVLGNITQPEKPGEPQLPEDNTTKPYFPGDNFAQVPGTNLDNGLVMEDDEGNQYVWIEVPRTTKVYRTATLNIVAGGDGKFTDAEYTAIENDLHTYTDTYRYGTGNEDKYYSDNTTGLKQTEYENLKKTMLKSVYEHGGFWIGRYEAGISRFRTSHTTITSTVEVPSSKKNQFPYTRVTCKEAQSLASRVNSGNYTSSLMFGVQWDLVLRYLETKGTTVDEIITEEGSRKWGIYYGTSFDVTDTNARYSSDLGQTWKSPPYTTYDAEILTTGANETRNNRQNIADISGNVAEWTLEYSAINPTNAPCTLRGGDKQGNGLFGYAGEREIGGINTNEYNYGFRVTLY